MLQPEASLIYQGGEQRPPKRGHRDKPGGDDINYIPNANRSLLCLSRR